MNTIFYSWQSDRPTSVCRNLIERSLQSAIDRLHAEITVEESLRDELTIDKDTKNVPGTPAIFDTILAKIASATVFVADLTFVGKRPDGRPTSNPNVLIEYGYALAKAGSARMVAVMNDAYGRPSNVNLPFNLAHMRFPITYTLAEDNAGDTEPRLARNSLTKSLEAALRSIFESSEYRAQAQSTKTLSPLELAALHQEELDYEAAVSALRSGDGPAKVQQNVQNLFSAIEARSDEVTNRHAFGIECGWAFESDQGTGNCILKSPGFGIAVSWQNTSADSQASAKLSIRGFEGQLYLPGEFKGGIHIKPRMVSEAHYEPTLSAFRQLGWVKKMKLREEPSFLSNDDLADTCVSQLLNWLRHEHQR